MDADLLLARQLQAEEEFAFQQQQGGTNHDRSSHDRSKLQFSARLASGTATIRQYEDPGLQAQALSVLPQTLLTQARSCPPAEQDGLARALLAWFKRDFFSWVNKPDCERCGSGDVSSVGASPPVTAEEREGGAGMVELYGCSGCGHTTRFPRFNAPGKLLQTRRGRCGEWANAFTLLCVAAGLETRYVMDWTDHVWTEFYSHGQRRWIHLDACEEAFDQPHLYEAGWGKRLSYVIAFGRWGVSDVSRRYSTDAAAMEGRQRAVADPAWVREACRAATGQLRAGCSAETVAECEARDAAEARLLAGGGQAGAAEGALPGGALQPCPAEIHMHMPRHAHHEPACGRAAGRQTGSVEWRAARGELGAAVGSTPAAAAADRSAAFDRDEFTARMHAAFSRLMAAGGRAPNEAALEALRAVRQEMRLGWPPGIAKT